MWDVVLFDLDGTLTDSQEGIINSIQNALRHFGIQEDRENMRRFVGPPLYETFQEVYNFNQEQANIGTEKFREYFTSRGWLENAPYPGVEDLLKRLKAAGKHLVVATSKPEQFAEQILEHFGLAQYFDHICGAPVNEQQGAKKSAVIRNALSYFPSSCLAAGAVMVGDRKYDVIGAHEVDLPAIGVLYGYGDRQELVDAGADFIVETIDGLKDLLLFDTQIRDRWEHTFGGKCEKKPCSYIWNAFDCGKVPALQGDEARSAFDHLAYDFALIFRTCSSSTGYCLDEPGRTAKISAAELAQEDDRDICVTAQDFSWTYVQPKRGRYKGPYFCKIDDIGGNESCQL